MLVASGIFISIGIWDVVYGKNFLNLNFFEDNGVPVVRADNTPVKLRPEDPGGMQVPNQGRIIYETIEGRKKQAIIEQLIPREETPLRVPGFSARNENTLSNKIVSVPLNTEPKKLKTALNSKNSLSKVLKVDKPPSLDLISNLAPPAPPIPLSAAQSKNIAKLPNKASKKILDLTENEVKKSIKLANGPHDYRVQIAATKSEESARLEWLRLRKFHLDLLGNLALHVTKADLGGTKGVFYRLRLGPLSNEAVARKLCDDLKKRKVGCLIVKPEN